VRHNHENRPLSRSSEADDNALDPPTDEPETETASLSTPSVGRRGYLGLLGAGVGSVLLGTQQASAQAGGYGAGEYGLGGYGGSGEESAADPPEESDDEDDDEAADDDSQPNVLTVSADPEASTATLWGLVWTLDDAESATAFFEYRTPDAEEWSETDSATQSNWGAFDRTVTGLEASTEYEYRAVVTIDNEPTVGEIQSFRTETADESVSSIDRLTADGADSLHFEQH